MPGLRARFLYWTMKNQHLFRLRLKKEKIDWMNPAAILRFREQCEDGARRFGKIPASLTSEPVNIGPMRAEWLQPPHATRDKVIFFVHGGGYVSGSCSDHRVHIAKFVAGTGLPALSYEYRLAPEHPYPAALEDSVTAYEWLLSLGVRPANIVFAGDSAGGGLLLALMLVLKNRGVPLPAAAVALSPWTDLSCSGASYSENAKKCLSPDGCWTAYSRHYTDGQDPKDPFVSPLFGDLAGLPPLLLFAGSDEILLDDSVGFAEKARAAGVDAEIVVGEGLFHCYPVCAPMFPEATEAMGHVCDFIKKHVG